MAIYVTDLTEADIPGAVKAVQQAFAGDPYNVWVYDHTKVGSARPGPNVLPQVTLLTYFLSVQFNPERNSVSLGIRMRWGMRNGIFHVAKEEGSDKVLGVAMWLRPQPADQPPTWNDWLEGWRLYFGQIWMNLYYGRGGLNVKRYYIWKDAQAKAQSELWTDPRGYYFLNIMVVLPEAQGKGVGAQMMKAVTDQADAENMKCYLESSRDVPNVAIYGRWGFKFQKEMICDDDGDAIKLFTMIREPNAEPGNGR
ncbi:N-acetyltransferase domain-containing protein [Fusarium falciforme]|nr:N-acetyltransferase domain-containing protein [Fusarium falciforme]WAO95585.1 N-acetyltransferase domain-containing protein [Fusarium falciforme]